MNLLSLLATGAPTPATNIEDVFSAFTRTGTGASAVVTTNINLSTKGGMVWSKGRSDTTSHAIYDTARGVTLDIGSDLTTQQTTQAQGLTAFGTTGHTWGTLAKVNTNTATYVDWSFAKQAKFFDIQTWTGNATNRTIAHSLGDVPGMIVVKRTDTDGAWKVYHRSLTSNAHYLVLNTAAAEVSDATMWNSTTADASVFSLGTHADVNANNGTYVAYLFGHDTSSTGLIQCGSFTTDGSGNATVSLGWEPQLILRKSISVASQWSIVDSTRGLGVSQARSLHANLTNAEGAFGASVLTATGVTWAEDINRAFLYLAIRRGPMAAPTAGTQVYNAVARTGTGAAATVTGVGFPPDLVFMKGRNSNTHTPAYDRLRGALQRLQENSIEAESTETDTVLSLNMDGISLGVDSAGSVNGSSAATPACSMRFAIRGQARRTLSRTT
jgi:hypothetical protein